MLTLKKNDRILFNGDSITDALRDKEDIYSLAGYSKIIDEYIKLMHDDLAVDCYNRGVGGDTSSMLLLRLEGELKDIKPTIFSLLIGVNDTWRRFDSNQIVTAPQFADNVCKIIETAKKYTENIIVLEPFLLNVDADKKKMRGDIDEKIRALQDVAQFYKLTFVPLNGMFAEVSCQKNAARYSYDGVHPTLAGHRLIAKEWLRRISFATD